MKKIFFLLSLLFLNSLSFAETVRINNKTPNQIFVNYQACFRNLHQNKQTMNCLFPFFNVVLKKGDPYLDLELPEFTEYARIINAYELDDHSGITAHGEFPGEEDCKAFNKHPITLLNQGKGEMICERS